jgi:antitoxin CcdA
MGLIMLNFENSAKKATNLSLSVATLDKARELGMNLSKTVDELLGKEVRRVYRAQWAERNQAAIESYNTRIASEGTFAQQVHDWLIEQGEATDSPDERNAA